MVPSLTIQSQANLGEAKNSSRSVGERRGSRNGADESDDGGSGGGGYSDCWR